MTITVPPSNTQTPCEAMLVLVLGWGHSLLLLSTRSFLWLVLVGLVPVLVVVVYVCLCCCCGLCCCCCFLLRSCRKCASRRSSIQQLRMAHPVKNMTNIIKEMKDKIESSNDGDGSLVVIQGSWTLRYYCTTPTS